MKNGKMYSISIVHTVSKDIASDFVLN